MMRPLLLLFVLLAMTAWLALGCAPQIGDSCLSSVDCPELATCDTTATGGYCLVYDCPENSCPDESVCVDFGTFTACMKECRVNGDCRQEDGQVCRKDIPPTSFCYHPVSAP
ncbi:MAG: hypothetical protein JW797_15580 [Bradymonadales bacterium]|nr:hypothetical protein [Bradymonadales bacterium]